MEIRTAVIDDIAAILKIEQEAPSAAHWPEQQYRQSIENGAVIIADEGGIVGGFLCFRRIGEEWELENIVVETCRRRSGVGARLIHQMQRCVSKQHGKVVWLEVRESNRGARRLYEESGFRETGRRRGYYHDPVEDAVLYEWRPDPLC